MPLFPEAMLLHHLDNLDSKMECMRALVEKDRQVEGCWTSYSSTLERSVLKKAKYLGEEAEAVPAPVQAAPPAPAPAPAPDVPAAPPPLSQAPPPQSGSLFAEKLEQAWRKSS